MCRTGVPLFYFHKLQHISTAYHSSAVSPLLVYKIEATLPQFWIQVTSLNRLSWAYSSTKMHKFGTNRNRKAQTSNWNTKSKFEYSRIVKNLTITSLLSKSLWLAARTTPPLHSQSEICFNLGFTSLLNDRNLFPTISSLYL